MESVLSCPTYPITLLLLGGQELVAGSGGTKLESPDVDATAGGLGSTPSRSLPLCLAALDLVHSSWAPSSSTRPPSALTHF